MVGMTEGYFIVSLVKNFMEWKTTSQAGQKIALIQC